jgi:hypothetical protein
MTFREFVEKWKIPRDQLPVLFSVSPSTINGWLAGRESPWSSMMVNFIDQQFEEWKEQEKRLGSLRFIFEELRDSKRF